MTNSKNNNILAINVRLSTSKITIRKLIAQPAERFF
jgi:hypothetical protein